MIAKHNRTRRRCEVLTQCECFFVGKCYDQITIVRLKIGNHIFQPSNKAFALSFRSECQCFGVCGQKICRADHIDHLLAEIAQALFLFAIQRIDVFDSLLHCSSIHHVLLFDKVEIRVRVPQFVRESPILGRFIRWRGKLTL